MQIALATEAASPRRPNEDFVAVTDDLIVVLDGATVPGMLDTGCRHGTRWFARQLGSEIFSCVVSNPESSLADCLAEALKTLADRHSATCDVKHPGHPSATVVIARERPFTYDYLVLADSTLAIETTSGIEVITDDRLAKVATDQRDALRATEARTAEREAAFAELTTALREYRNTPDGYWVAAANPEAAYQAVIGTAEHESVRSLTAMTDGASVLNDCFHVLSWADTVRLLHHSGPQALIQLVRDYEHDDADCKRWPRSKPHDDATAVFAIADRDSP